MAGASGVTGPCFHIQELQVSIISPLTNGYLLANGLPNFIPRALSMSTTCFDRREVSLIQCVHSKHTNMPRCTWGGGVGGQSRFSPSTVGVPGTELRSAGFLGKSFH